MPKQKIATFSTGTIIIKHEDGSYEKIVPKAEAPNKQTMPLDVEENVGGIPRDKAVGLDATDTDYTEYKNEYKLGDEGTDDKVVPRAKGDSGIEGWEKPEFSDEVAEDATSGKPDSYFQSFTPSQEPAKAGSEENHTASLQNEIKSLKKALAEKEKELDKEKVLRAREVVARKIVNLEVQSGMLETEDENDIEVRVATLLDTPVEILNNDLLRVKSMYAMIQDGKIVKSMNNGAIKTGINDLSNMSKDSLSVQSLFNLPSFLKQQNIIPTIESGEKSNPNSPYKDLKSIASSTTLARKFS